MGAAILSPLSQRVHAIFTFASWRSTLHLAPCHIRAPQPPPSPQVLHENENGSGSAGITPPATTGTTPLGNSPRHPSASSLSRASVPSVAEAAHAVVVAHEAAVAAAAAAAAAAAGAPARPPSRAAQQQSSYDSDEEELRVLAGVGVGANGMHQSSSMADVVSNLGQPLVVRPCEARWGHAQCSAACGLPSGVLHCQCIASGCVSQTKKRSPAVESQHAVPLPTGTSPATSPSQPFSPVCCLQPCAPTLWTPSWQRLQRCGAFAFELCTRLPALVERGHICQSKPPASYVRAPPVTH